jgi:hypothetical protein
MANGTVYPQMFGVLKSCAKTPQAGKSLHPGAGMANRADRTRVVRELQSVAAGARQMSGFTWKTNARRIIVTPVAQQARQPRMEIVTVGESRVIFCLILDRCDLGRLRHRVVCFCETHNQGIAKQRHAAEHNKNLN